MEGESEGEGEGGREGGREGERERGYGIGENKEKNRGLLHKNRESFTKNYFTMLHIIL